MTKILKRWIGIACLCSIPAWGNAATPMITAGFSSSIFLNADGSVWGTGNVTNYWPGATSPVRLLQLPNVMAVGSDSGTDFALLQDGTLWGSGWNGEGLLGDGTTQSPSQPQRVSALSGIKAFAAGFGHVLALKEDGTVWAWGKNHDGQLGDGTQTDRSIPTPVIGLTGVTKVAAGHASSIALKNDGTVWVWGSTCCGAAGNGLNPTSRSDPEWRHVTPSRVHGLDQVIAVSAGQNHHMALRADGTVWTWGGGRGLGENGTGSTVSPVVPVKIPDLDRMVAIDAKGLYFSVGLKADGTVWTWGNNNVGQLGVSGIANSLIPVQVPGLPADITAIAAGYQHVLVMRGDGTVMSWGWNKDGQLGDGTLQDRAEPRAVAGPGGIGQLNLLRPAPLGFNHLPSGQINLSANSGRAPLTVQVSAINVNDPDGTIRSYLWKSSDGQTANGASANLLFTHAGTYRIDLLIEDNSGGRGSTAQQVVVAPPVAESVSAVPKVGIGESSSIALARDGRVLTWGANWLLGLYDSQAQSSRPRANPVPISNGIAGAVDFAIGSNSLHVVLADGSVVGWGINSFGELGSGSNDNLSNQPQLLTTLPPVRSLAAGQNHRLALTRDGRVFAWGNNANGELGLGDNRTRFVPEEIYGLANISAIATGAQNSVALKSDGTVWAWGRNGDFSLGDGTQVSRNRPIQVPGLANITKIFATKNSNSIFAQTADGMTWATGYLSAVVSGDPGPNSGPRRVSVFDGAVQIAAGFYHVIALKADGTVWIGGMKSSLALGFADGGDIAGLRRLPGVTEAVAVAVGDYTSMILLRDGTVWAWGANPYGQLGDGTLAQRRTPVAVVNETASGFLNLIPGASFEVPPSVGVPFFAVASGSVAESAATISTRTTFNSLDAGKAGAVFVTASVPEGTLAGATGSSLARSAPRSSARASSPPSFVLVQLTSSGWQPVANGQLIPYASGVLDDVLAAQTILSNTDTTNLKGAQFCLGYGTSADQMLASGTMRVVATIPDPNATDAASSTCIVSGPAVNFSMQVAAGWNLLGNSLNGTLSVAALYGDASAVNTVWKWDAATLGWQFYTPTLDATALQEYAAGKGHAVLSEIKPGEGYWVNAKAHPPIGTQSGASFITTSANLAKGWNLAATGIDITPSVFNANLKSSLPGTGVTTLWAWDAPSARWYFYAPSLEAQGGSALVDYISGHGYLDFTRATKTLGKGAGFWVNRP